jgi:dihydrofolate reductase
LLVPGGTDLNKRRHRSKRKPSAWSRSEAPNHSGSLSFGQDRGLSIRGDGLSRDNASGGSDMASLIYSAIASLDGYVEDEQGAFDWAAPDDEVLAAVNDLERPIGTYLYGRRMYETMVFWETASTGADQSAGVLDFAELWRVAKKVVYSRTLQTVTSARTRIERDFDPGAIRQLKQTSVSDITVAGAELAGQALAAGLVDECHLFLNPILVGGGKRALPDKLLARLRLLDERRFRSGVVHLHYAISV